MTFDLAAEIKRVTAIQRAALGLPNECEFLNQMETEPTRAQLISVVAQHMAEKEAKLGVVMTDAQYDELFATLFKDKP